MRYFLQNVGQYAEYPAADKSLRCEK